MVMSVTLTFIWRGHCILLWKTSKSGGSTGLVTGISHQDNLGMGGLRHMLCQSTGVLVSRRVKDEVGIETCSQPGSRLESRVIRDSYSEGDSVVHQIRDRERCHEGSFSRSHAGSRLVSIPSVKRTEQGRLPCQSHVGRR